MQLQQNETVFVCRKNQKTGQKSGLGCAYTDEAEAALSEESGLRNGVSTTQILPLSPSANRHSISGKCL